MNQVIILNADYTYLNTVHWKKALKLIIKNKVTAIETEKLFDIKSEKKTIIIPVILKLIDLVKSIYQKKVIYSKSNIFLRDNNKCQYCGEKNKKQLTIDHIIPRSKGGKSSFKNCVVCCKKCNMLKGDRLLSETKLKLRKQPYIPSIALMIKLKINKQYMKLISLYLI